MFETECTYHQVGSSYFFMADDLGEKRCFLSVTFEPLAWYPAEPDVGAGPDFDAKIECIDLYFGDPNNHRFWPHRLTGLNLDRAKSFLESHHRSAMWGRAEEVTAEYFGRAA